MKQNEAVTHLVRALAHLVGNKVYLRDLEALLNRLELSKLDDQTLFYLIRDLKNLKRD